MKALTLSDRETMILALQDEIRRSDAARYDHRLHGVLLVAQGSTCPEVSRMLGDSARTVEYWVRRFEERGFAGLQEGTRSGRPRRLSETQLSEIADALRTTPVDCGMPGSGLWDGKTLSAYVSKQFGVSLKVRQCQRLFRRLEFRLRKPRPLIARARPGEQSAYKKTPGAGKRRRR
jgi:transposase